MNMFKRNATAMLDADIIALIKKDPDRGLDLLMNKYIGLVGAVVKGKLCGVCTSEDIEECVSDVFVDFYRGVLGFDPSRGTIKALLCSMAKNKAVNVYLTKAKSSPPLSIDDEAIENSLPGGVSVEEDFFEKASRRELISKIAELDKTDREIIFRKFYVGEPSKSIAKRMKMTVSAVDTRTHRALLKLREKLGEKP